MIFIYVLLYDNSWFLRAKMTLSSCAVFSVPLGHLMKQYGRWVLHNKSVNEWLLNYITHEQLDKHLSGWIIT